MMSLMSLMFLSGNQQQRESSRSPLGIEKPSSYPSSGSSSRSSITSLRMHESTGGGGGVGEEEEGEEERGSDDQKSEGDSDEDNASYRNTQFEIESEDEGEKRGREDNGNRDRDRDHDRGRDGRSGRSAEEGASRRHSDKVQFVHLFLLDLYFIFLY